MATAFCSVDNSGYSQRSLTASSERYQAFAGSGYQTAVLPTGPSGMLGREYVFTMKSSSGGTLAIQTNDGVTLKTITGSGSGGIAFAVWKDASNAYVAIP